MNAAKHYIYKSRLKSSYFLLFNHLRNYKLGSLEIKNFQKNMQSKCVCHPKMPRIKLISYIMVGRYTLIDRVSVNIGHNNLVNNFMELHLKFNYINVQVTTATATVQWWCRETHHLSPKLPDTIFCHDQVGVSMYHVTPGITRVK